MIHKALTGVPYPDLQGYDCEGYGLTRGIHKNSGIRRHFGIGGLNEPITDAEVECLKRRMANEADEEQRIAKCFESKPATADRSWGGHRLEVVSHDEMRCTKCGCVWCVPDVD